MQNSSNINFVWFILHYVKKRTGLRRWKATSYINVLTRSFFFFLLQRMKLVFRIFNNQCSSHESFFLSSRRLFFLLKNSDFDWHLQVWYYAYDILLIRYENSFYLTAMSIISVKTTCNLGMKMKAKDCESEIGGKMIRLTETWSEMKQNGASFPIVIIIIY